MKTSIIAATLFTAAVVSQPVSAQESVLENLLTTMVSHAFEVTSFDIESNVYQAITTASHHFALDGEEVNGTVKVIDIAESDTPQDTTLLSDAE